MNIEALTPARRSQILACLSATGSEQDTIIDRMDKPTLKALVAICKAELDKRGISR